MLFPAEVIEIKDDFLIIKLQNPQLSCEKCQKGEGCGAAKLWFLGFFSQQKLKIKKPQNFNNQHYLNLHISKKELNKLAFSFYLIPLFFIFSSLFLTRDKPELWQIFALFFSLISSFIALKFLETSCLKLIIKE